MATRYWVGGSGTWNASNTANWSTSSNGSGGASVPTSSDNVVFDVGSGSNTSTVTISSGVDCASFTYTSLANIQLTCGGVGFINVYGNFAINEASSTGMVNAIVVLYGSSVGMAYQSYVQQLTVQSSASTSASVYAKYLLLNATLSISSNNIYVNQLNVTSSGSLAGTGGRLYFSPLNSTYRTFTVNGDCSTVNCYIISGSYDALIQCNPSTSSYAPNVNINTTGTVSFNLDPQKFRDLIIDDGDISQVGPTTVYGSFYLDSVATMTSTSVNATISLLKLAGSPTVTRTAQFSGTTGNLADGGLNFTVNAGADLVNVNGTTLGTSGVPMGQLIFRSSTVIYNTSIYCTTFYVYVSVSCNISAASSLTTSTFGNGSASFVQGSCVLNMKNVLSNSGGTFSGSGYSYGTVNVTGPNFSLYVTDSNTFSTLSCTSSLGDGNTTKLQIKTGTTQTITSTLTLSGASASDKVTLTKGTYDGVGSFTISKASGDVYAYYSTIANSNATGGANFFALTGLGNVDGGNNTGWIFSYGGSFMMMF